jgi:hopene-associated glycosyltransferase HpnB
LPFDSLLSWLGAGSLAAWLYLVFCNGRFWQGDQRLPAQAPARNALASWPAVVAVVPARNESDVVERTIDSLLTQDYPGELRIVLVDDCSDDGTGDIARRLARDHPAGSRLLVVGTEDMPEGWVGKMWAVHTGIQLAEARWPESPYLHLTDADVEHGPGNLRAMVYKAEMEGLGLVSLMVMLHCKTRWEKLLIPAFVYFFQMLYPFPRINDPRSHVAGAAGGCMLVRAESLRRARGIESIRGEIIDDCALGAALKSVGRVWVGLSDTEHSVRPYSGLGDIWAMVARSAYTQLRHSAWLLALSVVGMALVFLSPPLVALTFPIHGNVWATLLAGSAWLAMAWTFRPSALRYRRPALFGLVLPAAALFYLGMTLDSARRHLIGVGGRWKGRAGAGNPHAAGKAVTRN